MTVQISGAHYFKHISSPVQLFCDVELHKLNVGRLSIALKQLTVEEFEPIATARWALLPKAIADPYREQYRALCEAAKVEPNEDETLGGGVRGHPPATKVSTTAEQVPKAYPGSLKLSSKRSHADMLGASTMPLPLVSIPRSEVRMTARPVNAQDWLAAQWPVPACVLSASCVAPTPWVGPRNFSQMAASMPSVASDAETGLLGNRVPPCTPETHGVSPRQPTVLLQGADDSTTLLSETSAFHRLETEPQGGDRSRALHQGPRSGLDHVGKKYSRQAMSTFQKEVEDKASLYGMQALVLQGIQDESFNEVGQQDVSFAPSNVFKNIGVNSISLSPISSQASVADMEIDDIRRLTIVAYLKSATVEITEDIASTLAKISRSDIADFPEDVDVEYASKRRR